MDDATLLDLADTRGTPCFVYSRPMIRARVQALRDAFDGRVAIAYAMKANPHPGVLATLEPLVKRLDVSSAGEIAHAIEHGWAPARLSFTGPGKRDEELRTAVAHGIGEIVLESVAEARRLDAVARALDRTQDVLVRIAPATVPKGFGDRLAGRPTAFGIDEDELPQAIPAILACERLRLTGLHAYTATQSLDSDAIAENWRTFAALFAAVARRHDLRPKRLVFGAGLGIPHHEGQRPLDLPLLVDRTHALFDGLRDDAATRDAAIVLESGRYLVGEAGVYLTRVVTIKRSRGATIAICDGGMNHHAAAAGLFGMVIRRPYKIRRVGRDGDDARAPVIISGPLCTNLDSFGEVQLPTLREGDVLAIAPSGAYGPTASPLHFIHHPSPAEHMID